MDAQDNPRHTMDRKLVSEEPYELEYLARTHRTSVEEVKKVIAELGTRSRKRIEEALDRKFQHSPRSVSRKDEQAARTHPMQGDARPVGPDSFDRKEPKRAG